MVEQNHENQHQLVCRICTKLYDLLSFHTEISIEFHFSFERKANKMFLKASQTLETTTGFSLKKSTAHNSDNLTIEDYGVDGNQELEKYLILLLGLQRLLVWERQLLADIIPTSRHGDVFARLAHASIEMVVKDAESITTRVLRSIAKKDWSAALGVFSALKHVILLQPDIDRTCDSTQKQQLMGVLNRFQQTVCPGIGKTISNFKYFSLFISGC